ncbi:rhodanese-like domain-containing protein [Altererythrobacter sp. MF3-039]|uniref:rhodanese-like domain-containing protein n=1 Tax=Altererythrobacter sp. MF3-039 TaxID=3252901 RepID=UPI00390C7BCE
MSLTPVTPLKAQGLLGDGARLVDIRSPLEFAEGHPAGAENQPLGSSDSFAQDEPVIFLCRTGKRTEMNEIELAELCASGAYRIEGGLEAWRDAGLPVSSEAAQVARLEGRTLVVAGGLVLVALLFGWTRSAWFFVIPAAIAVDMILAGMGRASILARLTSLVTSWTGKTRQDPN